MIKLENNKQIAFALLRITMGVNFFAHGFVRLPKIPAFRDGMVNMFKDSIFPYPLVYGFGTLLPFIEIAVGVLLIVGLFTRQALIVGFIVMISLVFGSCMIERFDNAGGQMLYALIYFVLLFYSEYNYLSIDKNKFKENNYR